MPPTRIEASAAVKEFIPRSRQQSSLAASPNEQTAAAHTGTPMDVNADAFVPKHTLKGKAQASQNAPAPPKHAPHETGGTLCERKSGTHLAAAGDHEDVNSGSGDTATPLSPEKGTGASGAEASAQAAQQTADRKGAADPQCSSMPAHVETSTPLPLSPPREPKQKGTSFASFMNSPGSPVCAPQRPPPSDVPSTPTSASASTPTGGRSLRLSGASSPVLRKYTMEYMLEKRNSPASKKHFDMTVLEETAELKALSGLFTPQRKKLARWRKQASVTLLEQQTDKMYGTLNKLAESNIDVLVRELAALELEHSDVLCRLAEILCAKAAAEGKFTSLYASLYAKFTRLVAGRTTSVDGEARPTDKAFRRFVLDRLQREFVTADWDDPTSGVPLAEHATAADAEEAREKRRKTLLGTIKFIGELHHHNCFPQKPLSECLNTLLESPHELAAEAACRLIEHIGASFDADEGLRELLDIYVRRLEEFARSGALPSRIRFLIRDELDLRENGWQPVQRRQASGRVQGAGRRENAAPRRELRASCTDRPGGHPGGRHAGTPLRASAAPLRRQSDQHGAAGVSHTPVSLRTRDQMRTPTVEDNAGAERAADAGLSLPLSLSPRVCAEKPRELLKANITGLVEEYVSGETADTRASFEDLPPSALPLVSETIAEYLAQEADTATAAGQRTFAAGGELLVELSKGDLLVESQIKQGLRAFLGNLADNALDCTELRVCTTAAALIALCVAQRLVEFAAVEELLEPLVGVERRLPVPQTPNTVAAATLGLTLAKLAERCTCARVAELLAGSSLVLNRFLPAGAAADEDVLAFLTSYGVAQVAPALCACCALTAHAEALVRHTPFGARDGADLRETLARLAKEYPSAVEDEQASGWLVRCVVRLLSLDRPDAVLAAVDRSRAVVQHFCATQSLQITLVFVLHDHLADKGIAHSPLTATQHSCAASSRGSSSSGCSTPRASAPPSSSAAPATSRPSRACNFSTRHNRPNKIVSLQRARSRLVHHTPKRTPKYTSKYTPQTHSQTHSQAHSRTCSRVQCTEHGHTRRQDVCEAGVYYTRARGTRGRRVASVLARRAERLEEPDEVRHARDVPGVVRVRAPRVHEVDHYRARRGRGRRVRVVDEQDGRRDEVPPRALHRRLDRAQLRHERVQTPDDGSEEGQQARAHRRGARRAPPVLRVVLAHRVCGGVVHLHPAEPEPVLAGGVAVCRVPCAQ